MVKGIERFREHFADYQDRYVLIGGIASMLAMKELGEDFRATKDFDIVLCVEALDEAFARKFWEFVQQGGYENRQKSTGKKLFYRFYSPLESNFPEMIELFARVPDSLQIAEGSHLTPIPVSEEISSLSAILLDDDYYNFIHERKRVLDGLTIIGAECLIPLKARAYTDLFERKQAGEKIDTDNIKKHKNDIFRLYTILNPTDKPSIMDGIKLDLVKAFDLLRAENIDLKTLKIKGKTVNEILNELEVFYELGG